MPGHVKLGKAGEPDPDPAPYLVLTMEMKRADAQKPYDPKKSYWCPDGKHGFMECMLESGGEAGGKATVMCGHEVSTRRSISSIYVSHQISMKQIVTIFYIILTEKSL